ncbi:MAG: FAD-dependent oxidoreductase [Rubrivivax sp.]
MKRLVLAGAGHAHALVLQQWARAPLPGVELVVVSPHAHAPYSGMVPGWLAGRYRFDEIVIDFAALCARAGARWIAGEVQAVDPQRGRLALADGPELAWDLLSLNIGSTLRPPELGHARVLALRPLAALRPAWEAELARWQADRSGAPFRVTAVGGGAAGVESLLAVAAALRAHRSDGSGRPRRPGRPGRPLVLRLVSRAPRLLAELCEPAQRAAHRALARAGVQVQLDTPWHAALDADSDLVMWAAGAQAHDWMLDPARRGGLAVSAQGFVRVDAQLRSISHPQVHAAGDCAHWQAPGPQATGLPKAGVHAVRMGPVLAQNLRAALGHGRARTLQPQRHFLVLLSTADGRAIAARGAFGASGAWAWWWKERIDRGFVARFRP